MPKVSQLMRLILGTARPLSQVSQVSSSSHVWRLLPTAVAPQRQHSQGQETLSGASFLMIRIIVDAISLHGSTESGSSGRSLGRQCSPRCPWEPGLTKCGKPSQATIAALQPWPGSPGLRVSQQELLLSENLLFWLFPKGS